MIDCAAGMGVAAAVAVGLVGVADAVAVGLNGIAGTVAVGLGGAAVGVGFGVGVEQAAANTIAKNPSKTNFFMRSTLNSVVC